MANTSWARGSDEGLTEQQLPRSSRRPGGAGCRGTHQHVAAHCQQQRQRHVAAYLLREGHAAGQGGGHAGKHRQAQGQRRRLQGRLGRHHAHQRGEQQNGSHAIGHRPCSSAQAAPSQRGGGASTGRRPCSTAATGLAAPPARPACPPPPPSHLPPLPAPTQHRTAARHPHRAPSPPEDLMAVRASPRRSPSPCKINMPAAASHAPGGARAEPLQDNMPAAPSHAPGGARAEPLQNKTACSTITRPRWRAG